MKQVEFRNIDKLFIKMSINDKFWAIFGLFLVILSFVSINTYLDRIDQIEQQSMAMLTEKVNTTVNTLIATDQIEQAATTGLSVSTYHQQSERNGNNITAVMQSNGQYFSLNQSVYQLEADAKQAALYSLLLTYLWVLPFALVIYSLEPIKMTDHD